MKHSYAAFASSSIFRRRVPDTELISGSYSSLFRDFRVFRGLVGI